MYCDVYADKTGAGDLLFVEIGSWRFRFLDEPVKQRFAYWQTVEINCITRPLELHDFQFAIIKAVVEYGYYIAELPAEWILGWKAEYEAKRWAAGVANHDKADGQGASEPEVEYIRPPGAPQRLPSKDSASG